MHSIINDSIINYHCCIDTESKIKDSSDDDGSDSSSRESSPGIELEAQDYKAIDSYTAIEPGQISFEQDDVITVLDKMEDGNYYLIKSVCLSITCV